MLLKKIPLGSLVLIALFTTALFATALAPSASGQEYTIELIEEAPADEDLSEAYAAVVNPQGLRIKKSPTRTAAEIWLCRELAADPTFEKTDERLYPFESGQLIGLLHFRRRGSEFRDQSVSSGWYTLRFGLQPIDGNHEGTSPTRDFLLLVDASQDAPDKEWSVEDLQQASADAAGSTHPAMMCLQPPRDDASDTQPSMHYDDVNDWWIARVLVKVTGADKKAKDLPLEIVVAGHALE